MNRLLRDDTFMQIAQVFAKRSTCLRAQVGCVIVNHNRIISTGYCGAPKGMPHCSETGCNVGQDGGCTNTVHAEVNAIAFAARAGIGIDDCTLYTTMAPCLNCAKLIINAGITTVVYFKPYRDESGIQLLEKAGVNIEVYIP